MKNRQLLINLTANLMSFGTSLLISFVLTPYLISTIGKEEYSFYPIANNFTSYLSVITMALNSMASRFITVEIARNNFQRASVYYSSVFFSNVVISVFLIIPMTLILVFLDSILNVPRAIVSDVKLLFLFIFASMVFTVVTSVFGVATFAKNRLDLRSGGEVFQGVLRILLYVLLFSVFKPSIVFVGIATLTLSVTNLIIQILLTRKLIPHFSISYRYFSLDAVKELVGSGIWNSINMLGVILLLSVSLLLANVLLGGTAAGDLSISQVLPQFIAGVISVLASVFIPRTIHTYALKDKSAVIKEVLFSQRITGLLSTMPVLLVMLFGRDFYALWVPSQNAIKLSELSFVLSVPLVIHGNMWTVFGLNEALNKVKVPSIVLIIAGVLNVIITYVLVKFLGMGLYVIPIVSSVVNVVYYVLFIPIYAAVQLDCKKTVFYPHIFRTIVFAVAFLLLGRLAAKSIVISSWFDLLLWSCLFGISGLALNFVCVTNKNDYGRIRGLLQGYRSRQI